MAIKEPKINSTRIIKVDKYNYAVQQYREFVDRRFKDKEPRLGWDEVGYFGHRLDSAVKSALMQGVPEGKELLGEFNRAAEDLLENISEYFGKLKPSEEKRIEEEPPAPVTWTEPVKRGRGRPRKVKD